MRISITEDTVTNAEHEELATIHIQPITTLHGSYVRYGDGWIEAGCHRKGAKFFLFGSELWFNTNNEYRLAHGEWYEHLPQGRDGNDHLRAAEEWLASGKALFSFEFVDVSIDSINNVLTLYVKPGYVARVNSGGASVILQEP